MSRAVTKWNAEAAEAWQRPLAARVVKAAALLTGELKKVLSVPAPRKTSKATGRPYATTRATPGAPPRKLTGALRAGVTFTADAATLSARVICQVLYGRIHEEGSHPWFWKTVARLGDRIKDILAGG